MKNIFPEGKHDPSAKKVLTNISNNNKIRQKLITPYQQTVDQKNLTISMHVMGKVLWMFEILTNSTGHLLKSALIVTVPKKQNVNNLEL